MLMREANTLPTMSLLGVDVVSASGEQVMQAINSIIAHRSGKHVAFLNANNANIAMKNAIFKAVLNNAMVLPDGLGVDIGARILHGVTYAENLNGTDFVPALLKQLPAGTKVGLYGAAPGTAKRAKAVIDAMAPALDTRVIAHGFARGQDQAEALEKLAEWQADLLLVAMGTPNQEIWIEQNITAEHSAVIVSVGALFDFLAGNVKRAPAWMRKARCEWMFRLAQEPARLWQRYIIGNPRFLLHVITAKWRGARD